MAAVGADYNRIMRSRVPARRRVHLLDRTSLDAIDVVERDFGAAARRRRRQRVFVSIVGALLLLAAGGVIWFWQIELPRREAHSYLVHVRCRTCGHERSVRVPVNQRFPIECPKCHERAAWPLWKCRNCGEVFLPRRSGDAAVHCPKCGSSQVGSAAVP